MATAGGPEAPGGRGRRPRSWEAPAWRGLAAADAVSLILRNGKFTTLDSAQPVAAAVAIAGDRFAAVGGARDVMPLAGPTTRVIDSAGVASFPA